MTTGFNATGDYNAATLYKTGDTIQFGGWSYVCEVDTTAGQSPYTHPQNGKLSMKDLSGTALTMLLQHTTKVM